MNVSALQNILFPPPPSIFVTTMSFITFGSLANAGFSELRGKHMQYSKFLNWNFNDQQSKRQQKQQKIIISSKIGMAILYTPAFLFGLASFLVFPDQGLRFFLIRLSLTIHFLKRVVEVLFVHKFGGSGVALDAAIPISLSYFLSTVTMIYAQHVSGEFPEPSIDLQYAGVGLFLLGIGGNLYHHYILSTLRRKGEKEYKIPKGGLFNLVICPHYLFEVLGFVGVSCIAQTPYTLAFTAGTTIYLMGRSYATKKWYLSKFEDFPKDVKAFLPFIF
ncbi:3-oxo-5-alpha-steroid 4-dehydrogenase 2 [Bienertia sinuspersici]